jgi:hypothetical protein
MYNTVHGLSHSSADIKASVKVLYIYMPIYLYNQSTYYRTVESYYL